MSTSGRFNIRYGAFRLLLSVMGLGPRFSGVEVAGERLVVRMGWGFSADLPRSTIHSAEQTRGLVGGIGVHGWRGRWLVNGAASGLVTIGFDPAQRARVVGFPVKLSALCLSLEEPERFVITIAPVT
ncbi:MAG: hypothetical protein ABSA31_05930 [Acidimicrobiales bacterium]|jgi:hypothetical protein